MFKCSHEAILTITLSLVALTMSGIAHAQETPSSTPPELRDFRLEPKPQEKPAERPVGPPSDTPVSQPAPATAPPPIAAPTPAPAVRDTQPRATTPGPAPIAETKRATEPAKQPADNSGMEAQQPPVSDSEEATEPGTTAPDAAAPQEIAPPVTTEAIPARTQFFMPPLWMALAALGVLIVLLATGLFWSRRKKGTLTGDDVDYAFEDAATVPLEETAASLEPATAPPEPANASGLHADFTPEQAQLSLANLTISGKLALHNIGTAPLRDLKVRTTMISASENQRALIRQFHDDESHGHAETIGDARAGEEIALSLEIQQPRVELNEFDWRERRFMAPIVLIHLSGRGPKGLEHCELSCLIGRENAPEAERMKPFHTDRGPRRFDGLGMRLVQI